MSLKTDYEQLLQPHITAKDVALVRLQAVFELSKQVLENPEFAQEFNDRVLELKDIREKFENTMSKIYAIEKKRQEDFIPTYAEITSFDSIYFQVLRVAGKLKSKNVNSNSNSNVRMRLPKLQIYNFDSKIENWPTFRDTFTTLVHQNTDISGIEKFYYLLSAVTGPALAIVKSMPVTEHNYPLVWCALEKRFENKRALATAYLDKLFSFKPLQSESATGLNTFLQTYQENVTALQLLDIPDLSSFLLFYLSLRNIDSGTRREFEQTLPQGEIPTFDTLMTFVEKQTRVLELSDNKQSQFKIQSRPTPNSGIKVNTATKKCTALASAAVGSTDNSSNQSFKSRECLYCKQAHSIYRCSEYTELTPEQRLEKIKDLNLCQNCLRGHTLNNCVSKVRCTVCKGMHHHTLHVDAKPNPVSNNSDSTSNQNSAVSLTCSANSTVLLGTAVIHVADCWGQYQPVRCIIDSGAMTGYITQDCASRLGLQRRKCEFEPIGLGGKPVKEFGLVTCQIKPRNQPAPVLTTDAVIVSNIAGNLPTMPLSKEIVREFQHLSLADPSFHKAAPVDMLLAADLFPYIYDGKKVLPQHNGLPVAMSSIFGYVIAGQAVLDCGSNSTSFCAFSMNLDQIMHSFWEVESVPSEIPNSPDDMLAEQLFAKEHSRDETGKYVVKYPFRPSCDLGQSRQLAERRLFNLESKLDREPQLKTEYHKFMQEYESLGHMTRVDDVKNVDSKYIIPHFCIVKPESTSTKVRVVFDASCKSSNGESLNSVVLPGPKLLADLNQILINFRLHKICLASDICKMYRQIMIEESQRPYQHILWRFSPEEAVAVYELNTVTYGVASSPYLAIKVLHTLAEDEAMKFPKGAEVLKKAFFMDDFLWSVETVEEAIQLQEELSQLLESGGFLLRKWSSNCPQVLEKLPEEHRETPVQFDDDNNLSIKVLGLQWLPATDTFSFTTTPANPVVTKRTVLSQIGRQFDPLGFVAPCVFYAKCIMQKLWDQQLDWDQSLPADLASTWREYVDQLPMLANFKLYRHATVSQSTLCQILGFCDASTLGYAAVVYVRTLNEDGASKVSLLFAKSKVAPRSRTLTIPRLELLAAHLLAKTIKYVKSMIQDRLEIHETLLFTDSSVVLAWLNTPSHTLKTFVATRVSYILETVPTESWFHVKGACNPADVCSRGALPAALLDMPEWLHGPDWLSTERSLWPVKTVEEFKNQIPPELKAPQPVLLSTDNSDNNDIFQLTEKFSSHNRLQRVVARLFQFLHNCRVPRPKRRALSVSDLRKAHDILIHSVQRHYFAADIKALTKGEDSHALRKLNPFIDSNCFLRVGGRLSQSELNYDKKHPLLLPKKSNFTNRLIDHMHKLHLHVGPRTLQSIISQKYWIISARSAIRSRISKCLSCFKVNPTHRQPVMGNLPKFRSQDIHVFHTVGIDIGGPFHIKESTRRNARITKAYLCIFVCCATKAVHVEVLSSLSTECFLASFDRFTARRGLCNTVVSDNGTNFVAAGKQLAEVSRFLKSNSAELSSSLAARSVQWKHNPPTGSHFGGIYEAAIKSAKLLIKRTIGNTVLTFEELTTVFNRVEAVLNSRPLCALSSDPNEYDILTPGHFLIGRDMLTVPEYDITEIKNNRLNRWQVIQQISQLFWKRWKNDYLHTLNQRQKWFNNCRYIQLGELVLVNSDTTPPLQWSLARVIKLHPGPDGVVRVVGVRTKNGEFTRPVVKLSPLPLEQETA